MAAQKPQQSSFWTSSEALTGWRLAGLLLASAVLMLLTVERLLAEDYNFVGNNADMAAGWVPQFRFVRAWMASGLTPWWNPDQLLGARNMQGVLHPYSVLSLLQSCFPSYDKGLDYSLAFLAVFCGVSAVWLFNRLGFCALASLLSGLMLASTGTVMAQLYSGHLGIYTCLCLTPLLMLTTWMALRHSRIHWSLPAALATGAIFCGGSLQGAYIAVWLNSVFFLIQAALGSAQEVPAPTLWGVPDQQPRSGLLLAPVPARQRAQETLFTLLKLLLIYAFGGLLSTHYWQLALSSGPLAGLDLYEPDIFTYTAPPISLLNILIPHFFLGAGDVYNWTGWPQWEGQPGMGPTCLLLGLFGVLARPRKELLLPGLVLAVGTLLALGRSSPFFPLYAHLDPLIGRLEVPSRMYFVTNFGLALLAAYGIESLVKLDWGAKGFTRQFFLRLAWISSGLWIASYYIDGTQGFWLAFVDHLQRGYNFQQATPVDPAEYYVLSWTRFSAAVILTLIFVYVLLRAPLKFRKIAIPLLVALDINRFIVPLANLRPISDFRLPSILLELISEKKLDGKVCNLFESSWNGAFGLELRRPEWNAESALHHPETAWLVEAWLRLQRDLPPGQDTANLPSPLQRALGVRIYVHTREFLENLKTRQAFGGGNTFQVENQPWQVTSDEKGRAGAYLSRSTMPVVSPAGMLGKLKTDPAAFDSNLNFLDAAAYRQLAKELTAPEWHGPAYQLRAGVSEQISVVKEVPTMLEIQCVLKSPAMLILNQAWDEDWHVTVDDREQTCFPCQMGLNRGVLVNSGPHQVRFFFVPRELAASRRRSWLTLVACLCYTVMIGGFTFLYQKMFRPE